MLTTNKVAKSKGTKKPKRRVGRGYGSGRAKTSGRGTKGQGARSNRGKKPGFEGGQIRLLLRLPKKKGFRSRIRKDFQVINLEKFNQLENGTEVTASLLFAHGWIPTEKLPVKILGTGELKVSLIFQKKSFSFSKSAIEKISKAGGVIKD